MPRQCVRIDRVVSMCYVIVYDNQLTLLLLRRICAPSTTIKRRGACLFGYKKDMCYEHARTCQSTLTTAPR